MSRRHSLNPAADEAFPDPKEVVKTREKQRVTKAAGAAFLMFLISVFVALFALEIPHAYPAVATASDIALLIALMVAGGSVPLIIYYTGRTLSGPGAVKELIGEKRKRSKFRLRPLRRQ